MQAAPKAANAPPPPAIAALLLSALVFVCLLVKILIIGRLISPGDFPATRAPLTTTVVILAISAIPLCWLRPRHWIRGALAINIAGTTLALADQWHFRFYGEPWSLAGMPAIAQLPAVMSSIVALVRPADALACVDIIAIAAIAWRTAPGHSQTRRAPRRLATALALIAVVAAVRPALLIARDADEVFEYEYQRQDVVASVGLAGYHLYDLATHLLYPVAGRLRIRNTDVAALEETIATRQADQLRSRLAGIARGRNLIVLSAESVHAFALTMQVNGQPLAPNLAAFARESLAFTSFFDQTHMGTTSDAEFMTMNSLLPLSAGAVATRYDSNEFRALPHVLRERGYTTLSACAEPPSFWNMRQMHSRLGFDRSLFAPQFATTEWLGQGKDDARFFAEVVPTIRSLREPFFSFLLSSSNHHPFRLPAVRQRLDPPPMPGTMAGDYLQSVRYFDDAFGTFIRGLAEGGVLDSIGRRGLRRSPELDG